MKIYIAGPITENTNYCSDFLNAENLIKLKGHIPLNPVKSEGFNYKEYIDMGICELMHCDAILMLQGWETSPGACLKKNMLKQWGLKFIMKIIKVV